MKDKRTKNAKTGLQDCQRRPKGEELTVHVSGKAQNYVRMGPREFVPFPEKLEFSIENIKCACLKHFAPTVGNDVVCDILTGPLCKGHNQTPDVNVTHVRFLPDTSAHHAAGAKKGRQLTALASVVLCQLTIGRLRLRNPVPHIHWKSNLVLLSSENPQKTLGLQRRFVL